MNNRIIKASIAILLAGSFVLIDKLPSASAHDGHKKGHAPATAKKLRNPVEHNTANINSSR